MKRKLISLLVLFMVAMATVTTQAQTRDSVAFQPHWFVQPQVGVGYHVGEAKFSKLLSPTAALSVGRQFSPVFGLRLGASGWQARNWQTHPVAEYKWNYVQANLDATVSLTNLIWGWNADRKWNVYGLAGVGLNIAFKNDDANKLAAQNESAGIPALANGGFEKLWDGTKLFPAGRLGAGIEYALSERVALGLEYNANVLPDKWNSKKGKSDNMDWQQNLLVGVKISLGKTRKHITIEEPVQPVVEPKPVVEQKPEPIVEKPKPVVETKQVVVKAPDMAEVKVYFAPSSSKLTSAEAEKLQSVVEYLKKYGEKNVIVSGYASSDGQKAYNQRLSKRRAKAVEQWLSNNGIDATRIKAEGKGEVDFGSRKESRAAATIAIEK
jgi:outer membrane protein OmpA-like peptidoglycan-associated protein